MPIGTPTLITNSLTTGGGAVSITSASISPTADSLIIIVGAGTNSDIEEVTSTFGMLSDDNSQEWHPLNNDNSSYLAIDNVGFGSDNAVVGIWWGITSSSPGSGTFTMNMFNGVVTLKAAALEITTGVDLSDPIVQHKFSGASSGTSDTDTLTYSPATGSMLISVALGRDTTASTISPDTSWTEITDDTTGDAPFNCQYRTGTTSTQYGVSFAETMATGIAIGAIEVREPTSAISLPIVLADFEHSTGSTTHLQPGTGSVTVTADAWLFAGISIENSAAELSVTGITDTFDTVGSWASAGSSTVIGANNVKTEWWYAQAASSGDLTGAITITADGSPNNFGCILLEIDDSNISGIGETAQATSASLGANTALEGTFGTSPASTSRILVMGESATANQQLSVTPRMGWQYIGPPLEEGNGETPYALHRVAGDDTFGGDFGVGAQTGGASWFAIEITKSSSSSYTAQQRFSSSINSGGTQLLSGGTQ